MRAMILPLKVIHPTGEPKFRLKKSVIRALIANTYNGKIHIEWDPQAQVTTMEQLAFFIRYLKVGHRFMPWIEDRPSHYTSPKAPKNKCLGIFCAIHFGWLNCYAHITGIQGDCANTHLLGMAKVVGEDSARNAFGIHPTSV